MSRICVLHVSQPDSFEQAVRVFNLVFDERPHLFEHFVEIFRFLLRFLYFLEEQLFTVLQQSHQLFVLSFQLLRLLEHCFFAVCN